jgi:CheY-like chemotaxis protein
MITPDPAEERIPRLLLAEDDPSIRHLLENILNLLSYTVDFAENGQQAVDMWERGGYDLVLMDVQMPRLDGLEATRAIRKQERLRGGHTPIIALTAHSFREDEEEFRAAGMDAYLSKPIDIKDCLRVIEENIRSSRVQRSRPLAGDRKAGKRKFR